MVIDEDESIVTAVLGGLGAAVCWTVTGVFAQRAGRTIGELSTFAWASIIGFCIAAVPAAVAISVSTPSTGTLVRLGVSGVLNVVGLIAQFGALRRGSVSVVVPIASSEGAIAAVIAAASGSHLPPAGWVALAALLLGVLITAGSQWSDGASRDKLIPVGLAVFAALVFGAGIFLLGKGGQHAPLALAVVPPSLMGVLLVSLPMAATGRLASPRPSLMWLVGVGIAEILGLRLLRARRPRIGPDRGGALGSVRDDLGAGRDHRPARAVGDRSGDRARTDDRRRGRIQPGRMSRPPAPAEPSARSGRAIRPLRPSHPPAPAEPSARSGCPIRRLIQLPAAQRATV